MGVKNINVDTILTEAEVPLKEVLECIEKRNARFVFFCADLYDGIRSG